MTTTITIPRWTSWKKILPVVVPPLIVLVVILVLWQILCFGSHPRLPAPTTIIRESWYLIIDPFFDKGERTKGWAYRLYRACDGWPLAMLWPRWWV